MLKICSVILLNIEQIMTIEICRVILLNIEQIMTIENGNCSIISTKTAQQYTKQQ